MEVCVTSKSKQEIPSELIIHHICQLDFHYRQNQEAAHRWGTHHRILMIRDGGKIMKTGPSKEAFSEDCAFNFISLYQCLHF